MRTKILVPTLLTACLCGMVRPASAQWIEEPGDGWIQAAVYRHVTARVFDENGSREQIFNDGRAETTSLFVTAAGGLFAAVDAWIQLPIHHLIFEDNVERRRRTGIGDPRIYLRAGPELLGLPDAPIAVRSGVKLVGGDFPVDAEIIPLGEGQRDWEAMLELGYSLYPVPMYMMGWIGYRWRETNEDVDWKPGNETFAYAAAGGTLMRAQWKLAVEGWRAESPVVQGFVIPSARREVLQTITTVGWPVGPGVLELGVRLPLAGRNLPAGPALVLGYFSSWSI